MKKIFILALLGSLGFVNTAFATEGACSSHGGVKMILGADYDGSVLCNDGWTESSVNYSSMKMTPPTPPNCYTNASQATNIQSGLMSQGLSTGSIQYTPDLVYGQIENCKQQQEAYQQDLTRYRNLVEAQRKAEQARQELQRMKQTQTQKNITPQIVTPRQQCAQWQVKNGFVADGICCEGPKGPTIEEFVKEYPNGCPPTTSIKESIVKKEIVSKPKEIIQESPKPSTEEAFLEAIKDTQDQPIPMEQSLTKWQKIKYKIFGWFKI